MATTVIQTRAEIGVARSNKTRQRLILAAARVVARVGDRKATIDDFSQEAGVARGTFYNHFASREELLEALWGRVGRRPFRDLQRAISKIEDPVARLAAVTRGALSRARTDATWGWLVYALSADETTVNEDLRSFPTPDLRAGLACGRLAFADMASARDVVVAIVRNGIKTVLNDGRSESYDEEICALMLTALGVARSEARRLATLKRVRSLQGANRHRERPMVVSHD